MRIFKKERSLRFPDAIGMGARKCGTVSLHYYFRAHPEVGVQKNKEMRFFSKTGKWHKGVGWYVRQFPSHAKVLFESHGGGYSSYPKEKGLPKRIYSLIPDARFLYLVRDPIERMISQYIHNSSAGVESRPIDEALLDLDSVEYVPESMYFKQLEQYFRYFDASRFLIVSSEDLLFKRRETLCSIFRFLNVNEFFWSDEFNRIRHSSSSKRRKTKFGIIIQGAFGDQISKRLPHPYNHFFKKIIYTPVSKKIMRPDLDLETRRRLKDIFKPDVKNLENFTGRTFEKWLD